MAATVGTGPPMYHLLDKMISATVGLVCINLQPEYELSSSIRFGQFLSIYPVCAEY